MEKAGGWSHVAEGSTFAAVAAAIEERKGRPRADFLDRNGDSERDMALYLGRRLCGLKLVPLAKEANMSNNGVVATNVRRYELRLERDRAEKSQVARVVKLFICEM